MKINPEDIKVGYQFKSYDEDDQRWYKTEIKTIVNNKITLVDIDEKSAWQGMEWDTNPTDILDIQLYKQL